MPDSYEDGSFATAQQHGDVVVDYPLQAEGDLTALVITRQMRVLRSAFTPTARGTALSGFTGSRLIYETQPQDVGLGIVAYVQTYATVPADRTNVFSGSSVFPFPAYQGVVYTPPATAEAADDSENLWRYVEIRGANSVPGALYIDYEYFLEASPPTISTVFRPTLGGAAVDFVSGGGSGSFSNSTALNGETFSGSYSVSATSPTLSEYATSIDNGDFINIDVQIDRYMGDIFMMKTLKMKAQ